MTAPPDDQTPEPEAPGSELSAGSTDQDEAVTEAAREIAEQMTPEVIQRMMTTGVRAVFASHRSGPLPPYAELAGYESVKRGLADRIVKMAESYQALQVKVEEDKSNWIVESGRRGQRYALIVALAGFATAAYLGYVHQEAAAAVVAALDIGSIVTAFLFGDQLPALLRRSPKDDSTPKA
ncbi:MAG: DUF2335 domain-containing protein [Candidatus Dormiibacterota bacterium]